LTDSTTSQTHKTHT